MNDGKRNGYHAFTITAVSELVVEEWYDAVLLFFPGMLQRVRYDRFRCCHDCEKLAWITETQPSLERFRGVIAFSELDKNDPRVKKARELA